MTRTGPKPKTVARRILDLERKVHKPYDHAEWISQIVVEEIILDALRAGYRMGKADATKRMKRKAQK